MKNNSFLKEIIISVSLLVLLSLFFDPFGWMPPMSVTWLALALIVAFVIYAGFIWHENIHDEREGLHRLMGGRGGFLVGTGLLVVGIILESAKHRLDPWLLVTLSAMVIAKIVGHVYSQLKN